MCTIPMDTAKVRLQIQKVEPGQAPKYNGMLGTMKTITAEEGPMGLFSGLSPGLQRQFVFAGLRIGLYVPIRNIICGPMKPGENPTLLQKIAAGMATGAIGISIANPTDLVKVRMQGQGRLPVEERPYTSSIDCYKKTFAKDGVKGLWVGWAPNVMRNSVINAAELASYDQFKQMSLNIGLPDGLVTHILCAFGAGFVACVVGSPVDVMKTRIMNRKPGDGQSITGLVASMINKEGPLAFYKGFTANFMRLGSWNVVMFVSLEQIKGHFVPNDE
jgi:solute carrier family 25 (mitochondrial uncoupling protein), member 8/9